MLLDISCSHVWQIEMMLFFILLSHLFIYLFFCQTECPCSGLPPNKRRPKYGYDMMFADDLLYKGGLYCSCKNMFEK